MDSEPEQPEHIPRGENISQGERNNKTEIKEKEHQKSKKLKPLKKGIKPDYKWIIIVALASFSITLVLSLLSSEASNKLNVIASIIILMLFVALGVVCDIIGLAVATCDEKTFHSMAARKIKTAKHAISLIRNAERVSSFCNDVIGDISGIVSGATTSAIAIKLFTGNGSMAGNLIITAFVAAMMIGLKAFGKSVAINYNVKIVDFISKIIYLFKKK